MDITVGDAHRAPQPGGGLARRGRLVLEAVEPLRLRAEVRDAGVSVSVRVRVRVRGQG